MPVRNEYRISGLPEPFSHYTDVVTANGFVFLSGMIALDQSGEIVGRDNPTEQARQALKHLESGLSMAGAGPQDVCKVTVFLKNIEHRGAVDVARREFFGSTRPTSTLVEICALVHPDALVEIEAIAVLPNAREG